MGKGQRTARCPLPVSPHPRSDSPSYPGAGEGSQARSSSSTPGTGYPGEGSLGWLVPARTSPHPGTPARRHSGSRTGRTGRQPAGRPVPRIPGNAFPSPSLQKAGVYGGAGEGSSQTCPWGPCPTAAPAWERMSMEGKYPEFQLFPFLQPYISNPLYLNGDNRREPGPRLALAPSRHRLLLETFGCFLSSICS